MGKILLQIIKNLRIAIKNNRQKTSTSNKKIFLLYIITFFPVFFYILANNKLFKISKNLIFINFCFNLYLFYLYILSISPFFSQIVLINTVNNFLTINFVALLVILINFVPLNINILILFKLILFYLLLFLFIYFFGSLNCLFYELISLSFINYMIIEIYPKNSFFQFNCFFFIITFFILITIFFSYLSFILLNTKKRKKIL